MVSLPRATGRRAPYPPSPLLDELVRVRLVEALAGRFDVPITVVVAGAGFGKTTALAQAIRANDAAPRGIDTWVACEPRACCDWGARSWGENLRFDFRNANSIWAAVISDP